MQPAVEECSISCGSHVESIQITMHCWNSSKIAQ